jgi:flagellar hook-basal body complex protein FliE
MSIDAIGFIAPAAEITLEPLGQAAPATDFSALLARYLNDLNAQLVQSDRQLQGLAAGDLDNLHNVMIALEQAKLSMQLAVEVRNKVLEVYQDVLRMQV